MLSHEEDSNSTLWYKKFWFVMRNCRDDVLPTLSFLEGHHPMSRCQEYWSATLRMRKTKINVEGCHGDGNQTCNILEGFLDTLDM